MYILDRRIIETDGRHDYYHRYDPHISFDFGESYTQWIDCQSVDDILSLPGIDHRCCCYGEVYSVDRENNLLSVRWILDPVIHAGSREKITVSEKDIDYMTLEALAERDMTGLVDLAAGYRETGFLFPDSSTSLLDPEALEERYKRELAFSSSQYVAQEIELGIQEIHARNRLDFEETVYWEYFRQKDWYEPLWGSDLKEIQLNEFKSANIELLRSLQNKYYPSESEEN